ncbi:MAG TPA: helix-turn-helix domain-containing protein [Cerasibacillus sp.]|uniref:helix-turn-helix domain-containing protein n=1 Tax=Cerasibacillus sp. TaxID=2498711 RepID=UPI002F42072D
MEDKRQKIIERLEKHLRKTRRELIKMDTEEEAIQFLIDSFIDELYCDFVGVILVQDDEFIPKAWEGDVSKVETAFPLRRENCSPKLVSQSLRYVDKDLLGQCQLSQHLEDVGVETWFTVPLLDGENKFGFCIIGFYTYIPLLDMYHIFDEFGQDVAVAISMARQKNKQLKELKEIDWVQYFSINKSLEESIREFTLRAANVTNASSACFYLYNEKAGYFKLQTPTFGDAFFNEIINVSQQNKLGTYFSNFEQSGGNELTVPVVIDLEILGVLYVSNKKDGMFFTNDDQYALRLLTDHVAILLENTRLYNKEKEQRNRLTYLLDYQQALVKETVRHDDLYGVTMMISELFQQSVILLDRFLQPITWEIVNNELTILEHLKQVDHYQINAPDVIHFLEEKQFSVWSINGVNDLLGYLAIKVDKETLDELDQLMITVARNVCSIQFIKQKLVIDANEQAKETFMDQLLVKNISDKDRLLQYANLFQWDIYEPHWVATLAIEITEKTEMNLLEQITQKETIWDHILHRELVQVNQLFSAPYHEHVVLFIPEKQFNIERWNAFYQAIRKAASETEIPCQTYLGIGHVATSIDAYYTSYQQSLQALNIVKNRLSSKGYARFEELGSYTILHRLDENITTLFMEDQLGVIRAYSEENNVDLWHTLRAYLQYNGNVKRTAEKLFMHRSTLIYRLEKIEEILDVDLSNAETRFDLMMAYKLYDMKENQ